MLKEVALQAVKENELNQLIFMVEDFWKNAKINLKPFEKEGEGGRKEVKLELFILGDNEEIL